jgi:GTPase SAR1 family protein
VFGIVNRNFEEDCNILVGNTTLYATIRTINVFTLAGIVNPSQECSLFSVTDDQYRTMLSQIKSSDIILLCYDITEYSSLQIVNEIEELKRIVASWCVIGLCGLHEQDKKKRNVLRMSGYQHARKHNVLFAELQSDCFDSIQSFVQTAISHLMYRTRDRMIDDTCEEVDISQPKLVDERYIHLESLLSPKPREIDDQEVKEKVAREMMSYSLTSTFDVDHLVRIITNMTRDEFTDINSAITLVKRWRCLHYCIFYLQQHCIHVLHLDANDVVNVVKNISVELPKSNYITQHKVHFLQSNIAFQIVNELIRERDASLFVSFVDLFISLSDELSVAQALLQTLLEQVIQEQLVEYEIDNLLSLSAFVYRVLSHVPIRHGAEVLSPRWYPESLTRAQQYINTVLETLLNTLNSATIPTNIDDIFDGCNYLIQLTGKSATFCTAYHQTLKERLFERGEDVREHELIWIAKAKKCFFDQVYSLRDISILMLESIKNHKIGFHEIVQDVEIGISEFSLRCFPAARSVLGAKYTRSLFPEALPLLYQPSIRHLINNFEQKYRRKKLTWRMDMGSAVVQFNMERRKFLLLTVSSFQMAILLCFVENTSYTVSSLLQALGLDTTNQKQVDEATSALIPLLQAQVLALTFDHSPMNSIISVNEKATEKYLKNGRMKIPRISQQSFLEISLAARKKLGQL